MNETNEKTNEKFPFTCPACGHGDDEQGNYCPECGVSVNEIVSVNEMIPQRRVEMMEEQARDALHIPEKKEKNRETTRKAVRVSRMEYMLVGLVNVGAGLLCLLLGSWWGYVQVGLGIMGCIFSLELVDVPWVPAIDRLRVWRRDRKARREGRLVARLHVAEKQRDYYKGVYEKRGDRIADLQQTNANLTKQHEQDIKNLGEEREAMVKAILDDRDANWIPLSNRLSAGIGADDVVINIDGPYKTVECTIYDRDGKLSKALVDITEIVLFSRDALPENKDGEE